MSRLPARILCGLGVVGAGGCGPLWAQRLDLVPFVELNQTGQVKLGGVNEDSVTYSELSAGFAAQMNTRRIVSTATYRLSYRIPEAGKGDSSFQQDGAARAQIMLIENALTMEVGALATQSRVDPGGAAPQFQSVNNGNLTQTYAFFVQPTTTHHFGDLDATANYRYGYVKNEGKSTFTLGQPPINRFSSSTSHSGQMQVGMGIGTLPFEWRLNGQFQAENSGQLKEEFRNHNLTLDIKMPIAAGFALAASGGYERNRQSQGTALLDPVTGLPVVDKNGEFIADPTAPRKLIYNTDGLIGDAGIIWRPTRHTRLEARVGRRYGGLTYSGLLEMKPNEKSGLTIIVSDRISSFGRGITSGLASAPLLFDATTADPSTPYQTCLFGKQGTGTCLAGATGQASASAYRDRAMSVIYSYAMRRLSVSFGGGYTRRTYIDDPTDPFSLDGVVDQIFYFTGSASRLLTRDSSISFAFSGNLFNNGVAGVSDVTSYSLSASYARTFGRGLQAQANIGLESTKQDGSPADISGRAQLGLHYGF